MHSCYSVHVDMRVHIMYIQTLSVYAFCSVWHTAWWLFAMAHSWSSIWRFSGLILLAPHPSSPWITCALLHPALHGLWGSELRPSYLHGKYLTTEPSPYLRKASYWTCLSAFLVNHLKLKRSCSLEMCRWTWNAVLALHWVSACM